MRHCQSHVLTGDGEVTDPRAGLGAGELELSGLKGLESPKLSGLIGLRVGLMGSSVMVPSLPLRSPADLNIFLSALFGLFGLRFFLITTTLVPPGLIASLRVRCCPSCGCASGLMASLRTSGCPWSACSACPCVSVTCPPSGDVLFVGLFGLLTLSRTRTGDLGASALPFVAPLAATSTALVPFPCALACVAPLAAAPPLVSAAPPPVGRAPTPSAPSFPPSAASRNSRKEFDRGFRTSSVPAEGPAGVDEYRHGRKRHCHYVLTASQKQTEDTGKSRDAVRYDLQYSVFQIIQNRIRQRNHRTTTLGREETRANTNKSWKVWATHSGCRGQNFVSVASHAFPLPSSSSLCQIGPHRGFPDWA